MLLDSCVYPCHSIVSEHFYEEIFFNVLRIFFENSATFFKPLVLNYMVASETEILLLLLSKESICKVLDTLFEFLLAPLLL